VLSSAIHELLKLTAVERDRPYKHLYADDTVTFQPGSFIENTSHLQAAFVPLLAAW